MRTKIGDAARAYASAHDEFERYTADLNVKIGGLEWTRLWRAMYDAREALCNLALDRHSEFEPPHYHAPFCFYEGPPAKKRRRLGLVKGGKP